MDDLVTQKISFIKRFKSRQHLRLHMSLILLATVCSGLLATRIMLALQLQNVVVRYPLAVLFAYLTFFIGVKLWLKYVASFMAVRSSRDTSTASINLFSGGSGSGSSGGGTKIGEAFRGGGGGFGGGGASGSFGEAQAVVAESGAEVLSTGSEAGSGVAEAAGSAAGDAVSGLDLDDGWLVVVVLGVLGAVIFGAGIYLIFAAPIILSEAAFNFILAAGLVRGAHRLQSGDWVGSIFRATWVPLTLTLLLSLVAGYLINHFFPGVTRLSELLKHL
ncbi:MAG: hypothetical protein NTY36_06085 [Deltaproteobacteria bacterium]|nr:hypothetical protein [Deltaproteobacteria bacterium]